MAIQYTSGTSVFNLDLTELAEEAFERAGSQLRSGYDMKTARRSMNLMTIEWANKGINLWTIEQISIPLNPGQGIYALPVDTIDLLDAVTRTNNASTTNQQDINISRISESTYSTIPNKLTTGRPIQMWVDRQTGNADLSSLVLSAPVAITDTTISLVSTQGLRSTGFIQIDAEIIAYTNIVGNQLQNCWRGQAGTVAATHTTAAPIYIQYLPNINIWPTPDSGTSYTFIAYRMRRIQDSGTGVNITDIPFRLITAFVAGLAYMLSIKIQGTDPNRSAGLKAMYDEAFQLAADEDREKASVRFVPRNLFYAR
jgi:hypothetical protein